MTFFYFVELFELDQNAKQKRIATFKWSDESGVVEIDGNHNHGVISNIKEEGIFDYKHDRPRKLYPYDGMNFLENLKYHFRSGYLLATDVKEQVVDN